MNFDNPSGEREFKWRKEQPESYWLTPEDRDTFVALADRAILDNHLEQAGVLFFLDRSARPVAWYMSERMKVLFPDQILPEVRFINVGQNNNIELEYGRTIDAASKRVRDVFGDHMPSGEIVIVDEFVATGTSMSAATKLLNSAFPGRDIRGVSVANMSTDVGISETMVFPWLKEDSAKGVMENKDGGVISEPVRWYNYRNVQTSIPDKSLEGIREQSDLLRAEMKKLANRPIEHNE